MSSIPAIEFGISRGNYKVLAARESQGYFLRKKIEISKESGNKDKEDMKERKKKVGRGHTG